MPVSPLSVCRHRFGFVCHVWMTPAPSPGTMIIWFTEGCGPSYTRLMYSWYGSPSTVTDSSSVSSMATGVPSPILPRISNSSMSQSFTPRMKTPGNLAVK